MFCEIWFLVASTSGHLHWIYFSNSIYMCGVFCNVGVRLKLADCRGKGKISTVSNNYSYLQAQRPQHVSLSFPVTCSYLRSEYYSQFVPVILCNSFKQRKWNIYLCMAKTIGQFQGCKVEFTWNWARMWRPISHPVKGVMCLSISVITGHQDFSFVPRHRSLQSSNLALKKTLGEMDPASPKINRKISVGVKTWWITSSFLNTLFYPWA